MKGERLSLAFSLAFLVLGIGAFLVAIVIAGAVLFHPTRATTTTIAIGTVPPGPTATSSVPSPAAPPTAPPATPPAARPLGTVTGTINITQPMGIRLSLDGSKLFVSVRGSGNIALRRIDTASFTLDGDLTIPPGSPATGLISNPGISISPTSGNGFFLMNSPSASASAVVEFDPSSLAFIRAIPSPMTGLQDIVLHPSGRYLISSNDGGGFLSLDPLRGTITPFSGGRSCNLFEECLSPDGNYLLALTRARGGSGGLIVADANTETIIRRINLPGYPASIDHLPSGTSIVTPLYSTPEVAFVDYSAGIVDPVTVPYSGPHGIAVIPGTNRAIVGASGAIFEMDLARRSPTGRTLSLPGDRFQIAAAPDGSRIYVRDFFGNRIDRVDLSP